MNINTVGTLSFRHILPQDGIYHTSWSSTSEVDVFLINLTSNHHFYIGLVAVVSDSFDIFNAVESVWGGELKELVMERGKVGGTLVIRPDSGDPPEIVVKVKDQKIEIRELFLL